MDELPVLLLLTSRPDGEPHLSNHPHLMRMRLNRHAAAAIVARCTGAAALQSEVVAASLAGGDGVPIHIEAITPIVEAGRSSKRGDRRHRAGQLAGLADGPSRLAGRGE